MFSETFSTLCWWKSTESQVETYDSHSFLLFSLVGMILMEYWLENGVLSYVIFFRRTVKDLKRMIWKVCTPFNLSKRVLWPYKQNAFSKNRFLHTLLSALSFIAILLKGLFLKKTFVPWDLSCWVAFCFRRVQVVGLNLTATAIGAMAVQLLQVDGESVGGSGFVRWASWKKGPWLFRGFVGDEILPN